MTGITVRVLDGDSATHGGIGRNGTEWDGIMSNPAQLPADAGQS